MSCPKKLKKRKGIKGMHFFRSATRNVSSNIDTIAASNNAKAKSSRLVQKPSPIPVTQRSNPSPIPILPSVNMLIMITKIPTPRPPRQLIMESVVLFMAMRLIKIAPLRTSHREIFLLRISCTPQRNSNTPILIFNKDAIT